MKKCALILLLVLGTSTAAWAGPWACVTVPSCVPCDKAVKINVSACIPGDCDVVCIDKCVKGGLVFVDIYVQCKCKCIGSTKICENICVGDLCPGQYAVIARVYCKDAPGCCLKCRSPFGCWYRQCAIGSAWFTVKPCKPCYPPIPWPF